VTIVIDASVVAAALVDSGRVGQAGLERLPSEPLAAPHLMPVEVASVLRRAELSGDISAEEAELAHVHLLDLPVALFPYEPFARRVWDLRRSVTPYDAWHVALAEELDATLVTLDVRLARAHGPSCRIETLRGWSDPISFDPWRRAFAPLNHCFAPLTSL
jgi:predicted nucleic acid-binding protein